MTHTPTQGTPGWAGRTIVFRSYDSDGNAHVRATVTLDENGQVACSDAALLQRWISDGICGRAKSGQRFPKDGQAFMDELPFMYKGIYLRAEPE